MLMSTSHCLKTIGYYTWNYLLLQEPHNLIPQAATDYCIEYIEFQSKCLVFKINVYHFRKKYIDLEI